MDTISKDHNYCQGEVAVEKKSSYSRMDKAWNYTLFDVENLVLEKEQAIEWCKNIGWLNKSYECPACASPINYSVSTARNASSDVYVWNCRRTCNGRRHQIERSVRKNSWIEHCNLTIEEIIKLSYMWANDYKSKLVSIKNVI